MTLPESLFATAPIADGTRPDPSRRAAGPVRINVRALLVEGDRILLANVRGQSTFHLPGGRVPPGDSVQTALRRLLDEQAGIDADQVTFVGCVETTGVEHGEPVAELDVVFAVDRSWAGEFGSRLDDLDIVSASLASLSDLQLRPDVLRQLIPDWLLHARPAWYGASGR
ncbi:ADP-ribose pyrophosphatase [Frankia canadensis]|uniref:ADP-ribose pyrophosphatase n=1 Tax=Frankia canadensis TaxID=1836972 RepID=A0A2I2KW58_9ACTN|nr:NUDIX domain-containing protein [Frankia canadensis]SNQ49890.1 ADP-ribose pyrophosphatase [Frankia canadensis]SOU57180.1 ADP-ribose pyrophosphatase [Frankia canadensis]